MVICSLKSARRQATNLNLKCYLGLGANLINSKKYIFVFALMSFLSLPCCGVIPTPTTAEQSSTSNISPKKGLFGSFGIKLRSISFVKF